MSDTELWQAWRDRGDASAFSTLVDRYLDMVYATARRILGNTHDAEEIAQECFITLLQGRVKVQHPLGPWLHRVARNRALDRIKGEARRRDREQKWQQVTVEDSVTTIDDVLTHVDAAIDALPPDIRAAIVGRFLEGKTNVALGEVSGVGESTIRARVNRGVELIRETLKQRGVVLRAAALGALLENNLAEAAPAGLRQSIGKLTLAAPPATSPSPWLTPPKGIAALVAGVAIFLLASYGMASGEIGDLVAKFGWFQEAPPVVTLSTQPMETTKRTALAEFNRVTNPEAHFVPTDLDEILPVLAVATPDPEWEEPLSTVSGTIYDDRGYPLPGAVVTVASTQVGSVDFERMQVFAAVTADDGTYTVEGIRHFLYWEGFSEIHHADKPVEYREQVTYDTPIPYGVLHVHATAPGFQTQGKQHPVEAGTHKDGIDYTMIPGFSMRGRVVWPDGRPAAYAGIGLRFLTGSDGNHKQELVQLASTDEQGEFLLGLSREGQVALMVAADDQRTFFNRVPADGKTVPQLTMQPGTAVDGTVTRADGTPVAGLFVVVTGRFDITDKPDFATYMESYNATQVGLAYNDSTHTDSDGKFVLPDMAAVPDALLTLFENNPDKPGKKLLTQHLGPLVAGEVKTLEIVLPGALESMTIVTRVVGEQSGRPLRYTGVTLRHEETGLDSGLSPGFEAPYYPVEIDLTEPGNYLVWPHYNNLNLGEERDAYGQQVVWEAGETKSITFRIPDPFALSVTVLDTSGNPVPDASVESVGNNAAIRTDQTDQDGTFRWDGFAPNAPAYFRISKEGYLTGETLAVVGAPMEDVALEPFVLNRSGGVEGRVVDEAGAPMTNAYFYVTFATEALSWRVRQEETNRVTQAIATDDGGTFVILDGLPAVPGTISLRGVGPSEALGTASERPVEIVAGQVLDLGDIVVGAGGAETVEPNKGI